MSTTTKPRQREVKEHPWYSFDKLLSHNAMWNFAVGGRGIGKTFGCKKMAVRNALYRDEEFIYLRRHKEELKKSAPTFMNDLIASGLFPEWDFRVNGPQLEASGKEFAEDKKREWKILGYFMSLSTGQQNKSTAFPKVRTIIFDEFILEKGLIQYLPDEFTAMQQFYSTVDRYQDKTRVFFLANSSSIMNPYFRNLKVKPNYNDISLIGKLNDGTHYYAVEFIDSAAFGKSVRNTKFGQIIDGTAYGDFAIGNQFSDDNDQLLSVKNAKFVYKYSLYTAVGRFSVWFNIMSNEYYVQSKLPKIENIFTTEMSMMDTDKTFAPRNARVLQLLRTAYNQARVTFDDASTRNAMYEIFKR